MKEDLDQQLLYYRAQRALLKSVIFWYISPVIGIALVLFLAIEMPIQQFLIFTGYSVLFGAVVYWRNQRAVKTEIDPLIWRIEKVRQEITEG